jgi:hypothetical protein
MSYKKFVLPENAHREIIKSTKPIMIASLVQFNSDTELVTASKASGGKDKLKFSFILTTSGANQNQQVFMDEDLKDPEVLNSPVGQPIDEDHDQSFGAIVGQILKSEYVPESADSPSAIKCYGELFVQNNPDLLYKIKEGAGKWAAMSMEAIPNPLERVGEYLVIHKPIFVGAGIVRFPGNKYSKIDSVDDKPVEEKSDEAKQAVMHRTMELLVAKKKLIDRNQ